MSTTGQRPSFSPSSPRLVRMTVVHPRRPGCPRRGIAKIPNCRVHRAYATVRARPRVLGLRELGPSDRITHSRRRLRPCSSRRVRTEFFGEVFDICRFGVCRRSCDAFSRQSASHSVVSCFSRSHPTLTPPPSRSPAPPLPVSRRGPPPLSPPPSLTVDGSALRLRSCLLFNASEYSQDGQEGVRSVPSSCG